MAFLQRLAESFKEGLVTFTNGGETPRRNEAPPRSLAKQSSKGKLRPSSASYGFLESHIRDAIAAFVQDKFDKGEAKPHVFTQFWLQFPKLEAGFEVLRQQLEARTGSREGPLPLAVLRSNQQFFGIHESSDVIRELCNKAVSNKCTDIDFIGLVMLLLVAHLTELSTPGGGSQLHPDVRTMLSCLELAFTHFNSARKGKLDKREVAEALQYEAAKAHMKEGARGRTSNRLAHRLFEGLDWEHDNTISFENFLRGILQLVQDEFGDMPSEDEVDEEELAAAVAASATVRSGSGSGSATPPQPGDADVSAAATRGAAAPRRCGSSRASSTSQREGSCGHFRPRSNSTMGLTSGSSQAAATPGAASSQGLGEGPGPVGRPQNGFLATLKGSFRKSADMLSLKGGDAGAAAMATPRKAAEGSVESTTAVAAAAVAAAAATDA
ncbi:hypothetical protein Vretimale_11395 [Volvox reticuliferus]|uniref:EF-hand domain-containing protein n=1 Tax=Volvox reticuliferus TaxID=1737510 RepID=A0A8J4LRJ5_9CHLO|nr:hypothetical protein Vretifemale_11930 [Volvox reticuliferus]GIM07282.1 hypothetical protein Vretimale_11395 [Volvox reticuliferus]